MTTLDHLPTPSLIVDLDKLEANISRMADKSKRLGVAMRPHVKTHKCIEIELLQQEAGACGLTGACFDHCFAVRGEKVIARWRIWNGR